MKEELLEVSEAALSVAQLLEVDDESPVPLYKQLAERLVECIETTRLMPGQLMPSSRELSKACKVSRKTIMRVYDDLMSQGYLKSVEGIGTFVNQPLGTELPISEEPKAIKLSVLARRMMQLPAERLSCGFFPELNNGAAPVEFLPMNQWRKLMLNFSRDQTITESNFVEEPFGYRPLREAISQYVLRKKGIRCSADQVVLFLDAMYSFYAAAQLIIDSGDVVAMEDPGFPYARMCIQLLNAEIMPVPVTDTGLDVERIKKSERKIDVVFITPSHQDPLGGTMPLAARNSLVDWAADTGAVILEDDYDNDFFYGASPLPALMSLDKRGQVYYFGNFYKVLYPLSAAGYVIVPPQMVDVFAKAMTLGMNSSPARFSMHEELAMTAMLNEGILEKHLRKAQSGYAERRYQLIASLTKALRGVVQISSVNGGMNLIVTVDTKYSTDFVLSCAKDAGLPMASTADYYFQEALPNQFLIAFAIMPPAKTEAMISKFAALLTA